jgi:hypothetical protein
VPDQITRAAHIGVERTRDVPRRAKGRDGHQ